MTVVEAQARLLEIAAGLEEIKARLSALLESVPEPPLELDYLEGSEMDVQREVHAIIECVLDECLCATVHLRDGAVYPLVWEEVEQREREAAAALSEGKGEARTEAR